jgi:hypothetical protein
MTITRLAPVLVEVLKRFAQRDHWNNVRLLRVRPSDRDTGG